MQRIFIIFFILLSSYSSFAQQWIKTFAIGYTPKCIIEHYDKGYIILGTRGNNPIYSRIIKTDINGNVLWNKTFGNGLSNTHLTNVENTNDNGLIIAGTTTKYGNQSDACLIKLNSCGEVQWCSVLYTPEIDGDFGGRVKPTTDNGYLLLALMTDPNPNLRTNLYKFDSSGSLLWHQAYLPDSAAFYDDGMDLLVDNEGSLILAKCYYPNPGQGGGWERFYQIRTDTSGVKLWSNIYGKLSFYYGSPRRSIKSSSGNYYSFGWHDVLNTANAVPAMVKVMNNGTDSYNKDIISNVGLGAATTANWLNDTTLILGAYWVINSYNVADALFKTDTLGNVLHSVIIDTTSGGITSTAKTFNDKFISIATDFVNSNSIIKAYKVNANLEYDSIYTHIYTYDSLCPYPIVSEYIDPDCGLIVDVDEPFSKPETHQLKVFPNPAAEKLTVVFPKYLVVPDNSGAVKSITTYHQWKSTTLEVYDLKGKQHMQRIIPRELETIEINISAWPKGMYFFRLVYNNQTVAGEKVIVN